MSCKLRPLEYLPECGWAEWSCTTGLPESSFHPGLSLGLDLELGREIVPSPAEVCGNQTVRTLLC